MHKLERIPSLEPGFLEKYRKTPGAKWSDLSYKHRDTDYLQLCRALARQQNCRCAYCECALDADAPGKRHIDHFIPQAVDPGMTFAWDNLVLSCDHDTCCGRLKDKAGHRCKKILNPYRTDGRAYLTYLWNGDRICTVHPKADLPEADKKAAEDTISAYGLNSAALQRRRVLFGMHRSHRPLHGRTGD